MTGARRAVHDRAQRAVAAERPMLAKQLWSLERIFRRPADRRSRSAAGPRTTGRAASTSQVVARLRRNARGHVRAGGAKCPRRLLPALPPGRPRSCSAGSPLASYERMARLGRLAAPLFGLDGARRRRLGPGRLVRKRAFGRPRIVVGRYLPSGPTPMTAPTSTSATTTATSSSVPRRRSHYPCTAPRAAAAPRRGLRRRVAVPVLGRPRPTPPPRGRTRCAHP